MKPFLKSSLTITCSDHADKVRVKLSNFGFASDLSMVGAQPRAFLLSLRLTVLIALQSQRVLMMFDIGSPLKLRRI
jgi:hypothetical protein